MLLGLRRRCGHIDVLAAGHGSNLLYRVRKRDKGVWRPTWTRRAVDNGHGGLQDASDQADHARVLIGDADLGSHGVGRLAAKEAKHTVEPVGQLDLNFTVEHVGGPP
jgi:hypothetical protein